VQEFTFKSTYFDVYTFTQISSQLLGEFDLSHQSSYSPIADYKRTMHLMLSSELI